MKSFKALKFIEKSKKYTVSDTLEFHENKWEEIDVDNEETSTVLEYKYNISYLVSRCYGFFKALDILATDDIVFSLRTDFEKIRLFKKNLISHGAIKIIGEKMLFNNIFRNEFYKISNTNVHKIRIKNIIMIKHRFITYRNMFIDLMLTINSCMKLDEHETSEFIVSKKILLSSVDQLVSLIRDFYSIFIKSNLDDPNLLEFVDRGKKKGFNEIDLEIKKFMDSHIKFDYLKGKDIVKTFKDIDVLRNANEHRGSLYTNNKENPKIPVQLVLAIKQDTGLVNELRYVFGNQINDYIKKSKLLGILISQPSNKDLLKNELHYENYTDEIDFNVDFFNIFGLSERVLIFFTHFLDQLIKEVLRKDSKKFNFFYNFKMEKVVHIPLCHYNMWG